MTKATFAVSVVTGVLALAGTASAATPTVAISGSSIANYAFAPRKVEVTKNSSVKWAWESNASHNVTFKKLGVASDTTASGSFRHRFKQKGTYRYVCTIHGFSGKVIVG